MDNTEVQLVRSCQQGRTESFGELYDRYVKKIYDFIYYKTMNREVAEDITSAVFTKALQSIRTYQETATGTFAAWLYRIARNAVIDHYRSIRPNDDISDHFDLARHERLEEKTAASLELETVHSYLKTLPPLQRDIILMRVWQELPYKTIAEIVGKSEDNCKVIYSRAIKELRVALAGTHLIAVLLLLELYGT